MCALFGLKTTILVQAIAGEASAGPSELSKTTAGVIDREISSGKSTSDAKAPAVSKPASDQISSLHDVKASQPVGDAELAILQDLRHRREMLDARARELDQREANLGAADHRLSDRVDQLSTLQTRLEGLEADRQLRKSENWMGLVKVYEAMKPRDAAAIFDVLEMQVLLQVVDRMQERRLAPVLAAMQPDRARLATQLLAEMRTRAVTLSSPLASPANPKN